MLLIVLSPGGVPGGVLDGELWLGCDVVGKGGIQTKFSPPQFLHSCVGGGIQGDSLLQVRKAS